MLEKPIIPLNQDKTLISVDNFFLNIANQFQLDAFNKNSYVHKVASKIRLRPDILMILNFMLNFMLVFCDYKAKYIS